MKKKSILSLIIAAMAVFSVFASGCQGFNFGGTQSSSESSESSESSSEPHKHTISRDWTKDETHHWHEATCGCVGEEFIIGKEEHTWGDWYAVVPMTCEMDGEDERMCEVCEEYQTRTVEAKGHESDGTLYYIREQHWQVCMTEGCGQVIETEEHTTENGVCECGFKEDPNVYWNDSDNVEKLKGSLGEQPKVTFELVYKEELPAGYEGDCRMFYKIGTNSPSYWWTASVMPGMEKADYEKLRGQGIILTSQIYCEVPTNPSSTFPFVTFLSKMFYDRPVEVEYSTDEYGNEIGTPTEFYRWDFDCATWYTLEFELDAILDNWDLIHSADDTVHHAGGMMHARGYATDVNTDLDIYWGDFQLVDKKGKEIPLSALN
ncbi:MAG: hypothetical protein IJV85_00310 [Clostridia bacterium]|nr:hypothetical protein [Clostridia bacterium]